MWFLLVLDMVKLKAVYTNKIYFFFQKNIFGGINLLELNCICYSCEAEHRKLSTSDE